MDEEHPGINIFSGTPGLGGALTNPTELAREKGALQGSYPVQVRDRSYADVEAAYQALKVPGEAEYNDGLMVDLICLKFRQHPRLAKAVAEKGGVPWLGRCSHFTGARSAGAQSWEGVGISSRFISNLMHGYQKSLSGEGPVTRVVHVHAAPFDVYIGRRMDSAGFSEDSIWHNPFKIGPDGSRAEVIAAFAAYIRTQPDLVSKLRKLRGQTLGCWCKDRKDIHTACHGDVLAALADGREWVPANPAQGELF